MKPFYLGIYDFELLPYALGDVLTWNVQSAVAAHKAGRKRVDIHICVDSRYPASIYQYGLINKHNCGIFFNELFGAFSTHPLLGNITVHHERERLFERLDELAEGDDEIAKVANNYKKIATNISDAPALHEYFVNQIHSHEALNGFAEKNGFLPQLQASPGCLIDIEALLAKPLAGKRIVVIHPRLRRLDQGYGGNHTFARDSDVLEWIAFIQKAHKKMPHVQFVVVGRLQEKPLALLEQPNVMSLRSLGLGLGHELTLLRQADLFIGTSSGFAAMANFCAVPYFITKMTPESCTAYAIPQGAKGLPFAHPHQELIYETEDAVMLMKLLERGLAAKPALAGKAPKRSTSLDPQDFETERQRYSTDSATTSRYFADDLAIDAEAAYLLWPKMRAGFVTLADEKPEEQGLAQRIAEHFPRLYARLELEQSKKGSKRLLPYARERLTEYVRSLNVNSLPPWLRRRLILIPARRLKIILLKR